MLKMLVVFVALNIICAYVNADRGSPYVFSYSAGRAPGHVDHSHTEVSDGSGVVRGAFSYIDPKNQLRTVQYTADKNGFHPELSHKLEDTPSVKRGKAEHLAAYNRIAQEHAQQHAQAEADQRYVQPQYRAVQPLRNSLPLQYAERQQAHAIIAAGPQQSAAVIYETNRHVNEFERIAAEHAAIGRQQAAERKALQGQRAFYPGDDGQYHPENDSYQG